MAVVPRMLPSAGRMASASPRSLDFGAVPSRPASLLCTLRTHQSPDDWQHSLAARSLALAVRDLHPLDFIKWFPLLHYWFLHFHAFPSATYRNFRAAYGRCHSSKRTAKLKQYADLLKSGERNSRGHACASSKDRFQRAKQRQRVAR